MTNKDGGHGTVMANQTIRSRHDGMMAQSWPTRRYGLSWHGEGYGMWPNPGYHIVIHEPLLNQESGQFSLAFVDFDRAIGPSFYPSLSFPLIPGPIRPRAIHLSAYYMGSSLPLDSIALLLCRHQRQTNGSRCRGKSGGTSHRHYS